jgi:hypothetical protein
MYVYMHKPKVFYTASFSGKSKYQKEYDLVLAALKASSVELLGTEVGNYKEVLVEDDLDEVKSGREEHYLAIKRGIEWADLVVLELSHESFQVGHEATLALLAKKHVLGLSINRDWSKTIINDYFHSAKYNRYTVKLIIKDFITRFGEPKLDQRMNLFLNRFQEQKLESEAAKRGVNKSELIRCLIDRL